ANQVIVSIDDQKQTYYTTKNTVGAFLQEQNLTFSKHDDISHQADETITDGLHLNVDKAFKITINDGGRKEKIWTTGGSVADVLDSHDIELDDLDKTEPAKDENVTEDTDISIVRVEKTTERVEEAIPFETEKQQDNTLVKGEEKEIAQGQEGTVVKTYEVIMENGEEVGRELVSKEIAAERKNRIIAIGTKEPDPSVTALSSGPSNSGSGKEFMMTATA